MSKSTYRVMSEYDKPLVWIQGEVKTSSLSADARIKATGSLQTVGKGNIISWTRRNEYNWMKKDFG